MFLGIYPYKIWPYWVPTIPKLYYDSESMEQRIKYLCREYDHLLQYLNYLSDELAKADVATQTEFEAFVRNVKNELASMKETIAQLTVGEMIWDVTVGDYDNNVDAMRDMMKWVTVHGITCEELSESAFTVSTLATCGLNARGLATYGQWLYHTSDPIPSGLTA